MCQSPMRVIALIDDPRLVEKILRHLGAWHDPPAGWPRPSATGPYTYEPCQDVDPNARLRERAQRLRTATTGLDASVWGAPALPFSRLGHGSAACARWHSAPWGCIRPA